jgi:hypothetical protein
VRDPPPRRLASVDEELLVSAVGNSESTSAWPFRNASTRDCASSTTLTDAIEQRQPAP